MRVSPLWLVATCTFLLIPSATAFKPPTKKDQRQFGVVDALRQIWFAQEYQKLHVAINRDADGIGEYASMAELASTVTLAGSGQTMAQTVSPFPFSESFGNIDANGYMKRYGYYFLIFLPDNGDYAMPERAQGGPDAAVNANMAEQHWIVYAWPAKGKPWRPTYAMNQTGQIVTTDGEIALYGGTDVPIATGFEAYDANDNGDMSDDLAVGIMGTDGNVWYAVTPPL